MRPYARRTFVVLFIAAFSTVAAAAITATAPGLPGSVAVLWSLNGHPGWSITRWAAIAVLVAIPLLLVATTSALTRLNVVPVMRIGVAAAGGLATVLMALHSVYTLAVNAGYGAGAKIPIKVIIVAAAVEAAIGVFAARYIARAPASDDEEELPGWRGGAERAPLWRGSAGDRRTIPTSLVFLAYGFAVLFVGNDPIGLLVFLCMLVGVAFILSLTAIVVEIDDREFRVHYFGGTRWPATRIAVPSIREVEVVDVDPRRSGGWGYRGNLRRRGAAAVNIRPGPGLRLTLDEGRRFAVTVSDADDAAQVLRQFVPAR